jgi:hypothetical protein
VLPWQKADLERYGVTEEEAESAVWWEEPSGGRHRGHRAVAEALITCRGMWPVVGRVLLLPPPVAWVGSLGYDLVARYRRFLPGTTPACREGLDWERARQRPCRK